MPGGLFYIFRDFMTVPTRFFGEGRSRYPMTLGLLRRNLLILNNQRPEIHFWWKGDRGQVVHVGGSNDRCDSWT
jgi:hypothetical protein